MNILIVDGNEKEASNNYIKLGMDTQYDVYAKVIKGIGGYKFNVSIVHPAISGNFLPLGVNLDDFDAWDAPPPPPEGPRVKLIPYDEPPVPLSPIRPKYPEIAQEAGIEGTVVVQVFVDEKGRVKDTVILKGIPNTGLDEAATTAIRKVRFRPAKQRERAVGVWISIPVNFRLKS